MIIWCYHYHYFKVYLYHQPVYQDTIYAGSEIVINENVCKPIYLNDLQNNLKSFLSQFFVTESTHNVLHKWHVSKGRMSPPSLPFSLEFGNFWFSSIHGFFTEILGQAFFLPGLVELTGGYVICSFFFFNLDILNCNSLNVKKVEEVWVLSVWMPCYFRPSWRKWRHQYECL